jgi:hypothetical protein
MGDIGSALSDTFSGVGDAISGGVNALSGALGGGGNLASTLGNMMGSMTGGASAAASPASTANAVGQTIDPTGTIAAQESLSPPGGGTPQQQADTTGGTQSDAPQPAQPAPRPAPRPSDAGADTIRKLIQSLRGGGNAYQTGGGQQGPNPIESWENEGGAVVTPATLSADLAPASHSTNGSGQVNGEHRAWPFPRG